MDSRLARIRPGAEKQVTGFRLNPEGFRAVIQSIMTEEKSRLVYSTDKVIPRKENPAMKKPQLTAQHSEQVHVRLERKGRKGKSVTLIDGLRIPATNREALLKQLKTKLGTGGTERDGIIEIQGDHRDAIIPLLQDMGYKAKRAGR
jgi:translation initiation factor 1